jgi:hypothetical protein
MKMKNIFIFMFVQLLFTFNLDASGFIDIVYLKDGSKIEGEILENVHDKYLVIRTRNGENKTVLMENVLKINKRNKNNVTLKNESYSELGLNFGTPAGINLFLSHWVTSFGLGVSGMALGNDTYGIQFELRYKLFENFSRYHDFAFIFGTNQVNFGHYFPELVKSKNYPKLYQWGFYGLAYQLNFYGIWLEAGATFGTGNVVSPQIDFQLGYTHRFLD